MDSFGGILVQIMLGLRAVFILLTIVVTCRAAEHLPIAKPRDKVRIVCFNGKLDSRSSCSTTNFQKDGVMHSKGKMKCGFQGHVSEIEWVLIGQKNNQDVYRFTRRYPIDTAAVVTTTKDVVISTRREVVFEDDSQAIVVEPLEKAAE